ncbi:hypothetical protein AAY473_019175 [Plecturocebus cupreus]
MRVGELEVETVQPRHELGPISALCQPHPHTGQWTECTESRASGPPVHPQGRKAKTLRQPLVHPSKQHGWLLLMLFSPFLENPPHLKGYFLQEAFLDLPAAGSYSTLGKPLPYHHHHHASKL